MGESITGVTTGVIAADVADQSSAWALVAGDRRLASRPGAPRLSKRKVLVAVGRRGLPKLVEATLVPAILFFLVVTTLGEGAAMVAVLA